MKKKMTIISKLTGELSIFEMELDVEDHVPECEICFKKTIPDYENCPHKKDVK